MKTKRTVAEQIEAIRTANGDGPDYGAMLDAWLSRLTDADLWILAERAVPPTSGGSSSGRDMLVASQVEFYRSGMPNGRGGPKK